jgi:ribosomal protein S18 acetylase RimI-like enzyme
VLARTWRMRAWPSDATVAHLIFVDHQTPPTRSDLADAIAHAERKGARAIRTSAMFPDAARVVLAEGFTTIDRLALLHRSLASDDAERGDVTRADHRIGPVRSWHLAACARIDRAAFGLMWGNSPASLRDIRRATPVHHARLARTSRAVGGFAISGAAADTGYLQRLAVAPEYRRLGLARRLTIDSLDWMRRNSLRRAMVNTGIDNDAALSLYRSLGFSALPDELTIAELQLG